jgi:site-specific DNA-methyltransferase (adenine-specific)
LRSYGEPGAMVYLADCVELMRLMPVACVDVVFADPPYPALGRRRDREERP